MRLPHRPAAMLAAFGLALATLTLTLGLAPAPNPADASPPAFHQVVAGLAGDSSSGFMTLATVTPTATATATPQGNSCTSGHGSLLAFNDPGAQSLDRTNPQAQTVSFFNLLARPLTIPTDATRTAPLETTFYTVTANLVSLALGPNGSWDIVIDSGGGMTMRASFPAQNCLTALSADQQGAMNGARNMFRTACGQPPSAGSKALRGAVTVTGPGYWGTKAIEGASTSGAELGPIFAFTFNETASCDANHPPTPTPAPSVEPLQFVHVVSDHDGITGYHRGDVVTATAYLTPAVAGVTCSPQYTNPASVSSSGTVISDPGLVPKTSRPDGAISWQFTIPADSPPGSPPTGGRFEVMCPNGKEAVESITIHVP